MTKKEGIRLEYLDGLRALAALYVVLFHAALGFSDNVKHSLPSWVRAVRVALSFGHDAVAVFIVLSGYCLMLPVAREEGQMVRGVAHYFARRAWRILPPYYAALLGCLLLLYLVPSLQAHTGTIWDDTSPPFEFGSVVTHLVLVHNWFPAFTNRIDGPLWSVATEWQIYFFFPLLLLPTWRRYGWCATIGVGFALGKLFLIVFHSAAHTACAWYVGLFALGQAAAGINFASRGAESRLREGVPWGWLALATLVPVGIGVGLFRTLWFQWLPLSDALVGLSTATCLVYLTRHALRPAAEPRPWALRLLDSRPLVALGRFSYSLYLTHLPLVALFFLALRARALPPTVEWALLVLLGLPLSLLAAYAFYWVFERRFVGSPPVLFGKRAG